MLISVAGTGFGLSWILRQFLSVYSLHLICSLGGLLQGGIIASNTFLACDFTALIFIGKVMQLWTIWHRWGLIKRFPYGLMLLAPDGYFSRLWYAFSSHLSVYIPLVIISVLYIFLLLVVSVWIFLGLVYRAHWLVFVWIFAVFSGRAWSCPPPFLLFAPGSGLFRPIFYLYFYNITL